jgi:hypothetical protein
MAAHDEPKFAIGFPGTAIHIQRTDKYGLSVDDQRFGMQTCQRAAERVEAKGLITQVGPDLVKLDTQLE